MLIYEKAKELPEKTQLAIAIIENGNPCYYGTIRKGDSLKTIINHQLAFEIGSITKVFTSTMMAEFALENKIKLDDPINTYIGLPLTKNKNITFKRLSNHTSGLPRLPTNHNPKKDYKNPYKGYDDDLLIACIREILNEEPKEEPLKHRYSNLGVGLLGYTLCQVGASDYQFLLDSMILSKFNMSNTTTIRADIEHSLVKGLDEDGDETPNWDLGALVSAGGIFSTAEDLSKFALGQFDPSNKAFELISKKTIQIDENLDIALGWLLPRSLSGATWHGHTGGTGGYSSYMILDVKRRNAVIILSNLSPYNKKSGNMMQLTKGLMEILEKRSDATI